MQRKQRNGVEKKGRERLRNGKVSLRSGLEAPSKAKAMRRLQTLRNGEEMRCDESEKHSVDRLWISGEVTCIGEDMHSSGKAEVGVAQQQRSAGVHGISFEMRGIGTAQDSGEPKRQGEALIR